MKTAIVIGAGPAGLTAAHELVAKGEGAWRILVLEESSALGGISRTVVHFSDRQVAVGCGVYLFMPDTIVYSLCHMPDQLAVTAIIASLWFSFRAVSGRRLALVGAALSFVVAVAWAGCPPGSSLRA